MLENGTISEDELWNKYKIKIIEEKFSQPKIGNDISKSYAYEDAAKLAVNGVTVIPQ